MAPTPPTPRSLAPALALALLVPLAGSLGPAAEPLAPSAAAPVVPPLASGVVGAGLDALALAERVGQSGSASAALAAAGVLPEPAAAATGPRSADLRAALARLEPDAAAADGAAPFAGLDAETQRALVPLLDAVADAAALVDRAFAALSPAERALVLAHALGSPAASEGPDADRLASLVDPAPLAQAAQLLLTASEAFLASVPAPSQASAAGAGGAGIAATGNLCSTLGSSLISPGGLVEVGLTGPNGYLTPRVLQLDLGGDDCYENHPAATGPGGPGPLPISLLVDVGGNDRYYTDLPTGIPPATTWSAGVGIGGVGLLVDRWGRDQYAASLTNQPHSCPTLPAHAWQRVYAQGVGILGAGGLVDLGGDDIYTASSANAVPDATCASGRAYAYAQGVGARLGVGFLVDSTGNDEYAVSASSQRSSVSAAHAHGQGAAAARGIGALIDEEGNDAYAAGSGALLTSGFQDGATAYTFAQASLYGTNEPRDESLNLDCRQLGIPCDCRDLGLGLTCDCRDLGIACDLDCTVAPQVCGLVGTGAVIPAVPRAPTLPLNPCTSKQVSPTVDPTGGLADAGAPCDNPAYALLLDAAGIDRYAASSSATSSPGVACGQAVWAGTAAQGSAPAKGLAVLADAAVDTFNNFTATATADASGCLAGGDQLADGVRAASFSQGFGGAFLWDPWDRPPFDPFLLTDLAAGVLARGGACGRDLDFSGFPSSITLNLQPDDPCDVAWADDRYTARATATNPASTGLAWAQARAQGSGNGDLGTTGTPVPGGPYQAFGLGGLVDLFGDDGHTAEARATATSGVADPFAVAQGAGTSGYGVLANVGDVDSYQAWSYRNGAQQPVPHPGQWSLPWVVAQADSTVPTPVIFRTVGPVTVIVDNAAGILVDVFGGPSDAYSLAPYCPNNGAFPLNPYTWGNQPPLSNLGPTACGADRWNNYIAPPALTGTRGTAFGLDW